MKYCLKKYNGRRRSPVFFENPAYGDNDGDDDDQEINRDGPPEFDSTWSFGPGAASTPGEQYEMQTMMHEQSGLHDASNEETPFLNNAQAINQISWDALTRKFPNASTINLETSYSRTGRLQVKMYGFGKKSYPLFTRDNNTGRERLNPSLPKEIIKSLGNSAEQIIAEDRVSIREQRQRLEEAENQQRQAEALAAERGKQSQEIQNLSQQIERTQARIDALQEEQGSNLESEAELNRLKQLKKNYKTDLEKKKKELAGLEKQAKDKEKIQAKLYEIERERNTIEERLNSTKRTDELEDDEGRLKRLNEEDQAIIDDVYASEFDKDAARERMAARDEDLLRLKDQISERENSLSLRERIKAIFKKYGVTVASILLAAGVTIGAVMGNCACLSLLL